MIYSKTCEYAIRSLIPFTQDKSSKYRTVKDISAESGVPQAYVAKIFQCLAKNKIVESIRGPKGGYALKGMPEELSLMRVIAALDDLSKSPFSNCIMGLHQCNDKNPCPLHPIWMIAKEEMLNKLNLSSIVDVAGLIDKFNKKSNGRTKLSKKMRELFAVAS